MDARSWRFGWQVGVLALALVGAGGCKSKSKSSCDQAKLATLAEQLEAAEPEARVALVSEGLMTACKGTPYEPVEDMFLAVTRPDERRPYLRREVDPVFRAARQRICPRHDELVARFADAPTGERASIAYEVCGFARYDLLDEASLLELDFSAGMLTWTTHDFLLSQGTPVEIAKTISRAVAFAEIENYNSLNPPLRGQSLVTAPVATRVPEGLAVYVSMKEIVFNEQPIASLQSGELRAEALSGHVIIPMVELLADEVEKTKQLAEQLGQPWNSTLVVVADRGVALSTVVDILYTASLRKFTQFAFVVEPAYPVKRAILVGLPQFGSDAPFHVLLGDDGYRVDAGDGQRVTLAKLDPDGTGPSAWDLAGLVVAASEAVAAHPELEKVVVTVQADVSTEVLLATYAALLGPGCDQREPTTCLLPELALGAAQK